MTFNYSLVTDLIRDTVSLGTKRVAEQQERLRIKRAREEEERKQREAEEAARLQKEAEERAARKAAEEAEEDED